MWKYKIQSCNGKLPRRFLDVLTVTSKIRVFHEAVGVWTGLGMHEASGTNMGPFWTNAEALFGLALSSSQGGLRYRVYV